MDQILAKSFWNATVFHRHDMICIVSLRSLINSIERSVCSLKGERAFLCVFVKKIIYIYNKKIKMRGNCCVGARSVAAIFWLCTLGCNAFSVSNFVYSRSTALFKIANPVSLSKYHGRKQLHKISDVRKQLHVMASSTSDEERELTNEECEVLNLPYGTKLIGDMSDRCFYSGRRFTYLISEMFKRLTSF